MICYSLKCAGGHRFESWFQSSDAFDTLSAAGMVECPECGLGEVTKAMMAPRLGQKDTPPAVPAPTAAAKPTLSLAGGGGEVEKAIRRLKTLVESHSDYVGSAFAQEARRIHAGEAPERSIHGEARADEARALAEDGIPVLPLPFQPTRKTN